MEKNNNYRLNVSKTLRTPPALCSIETFEFLFLFFKLVFVFFMS